MKHDRHGQAEPMTKEIYLKIREKLNNTYQLLLDIAFYTGERWGAILQLQIEDVYENPEKRSIRDNITFRARTRKDRNTRQVPIHPELQLRLRVYDPPLTGYLFANPKTGEPKTFQAADTAFRLALKKCGLGNGYSTHSTRRGFITALHNKGFSIRVIQSLTGHKSMNVVSGYVEISDEQRQSAIKSL